MTDSAALATALQNAAEAMHNDPTLDALCHAIWDTPDAPPSGAPDDIDVYTDAIKAIAKRCGIPIVDVPALPHGRAQMAARIEAARYRSYG